MFRHAAQGTLNDRCGSPPHPRRGGPRFHLQRFFNLELRACSHDRSQQFRYRARPARAPTATSPSRNPPHPCPDRARYGHHRRPRRRRRVRHRQGDCRFPGPRFTATRRRFPGDSRHWGSQPVVLWQASALTALALLAGLPLGIVAGRWSWAIFAGSLGVATDPAVPAPALLAIIPAALILASLIAAGPGWRAAQMRPAAILLSE